MRSFSRIVLVAATLFAGEVSAEPPMASPSAVPNPPAHTAPSFEPFKWITSYDEARAHGKRAQRPVMLFVTMSGCHYCDKMHDESFADVAVANELADSFVPTRLYLDPKSKLAKSLKITLFPTTMFIAPDGKILGYVRGYVPREEFQVEMQSAKAANVEQLRLATKKAKAEKK